LLIRFASYVLPLGPVVNGVDDSCADAHGILCAAALTHCVAAAGADPLATRTAVLERRSMGTTTD